MVGFIQSGRFGVAFNPLSLSPALWLDASDTATITSSGGAVSQWNDKSGGTNHFVQATAGNKPTTASTTKNGLNVVTFDGGDFMTCTLSTISQPLSVVFVARNTTPTTTGGRILCTSFTFQTVHSDGSAGYRTAITFANGADFAKGPADAYSTSVYGVSSFVVNGASTKAYVNGTAGSAFNAGAASAGGAMTLGARGGPVTAYLTGQIAELFLIPSALSDTDRQALESYLNAKWAVY